MKKINFTNRETNVFGLMMFAELGMISANGEIGRRTPYTKKWNEFFPELQKVTEDIHKLTAFLDYCFNTSGIPENELDSIKIQAKLFVDILLKVEHPEIRLGVHELAQKAQKLELK